MSNPAHVGPGVDRCLVACVGLGVPAFTGYGLILITVGATIYAVGRLTYSAGG